MRKTLFLAMAVLTPLATVTPAMALKTTHKYDVRFDGLKVGTWRLRNKVVETAHACRYTVQWSDLAGPPLSRTRLCRIDEIKAGDDFDCEVSRKGFFDTLITKAPGTCRGFDDFGQQTDIKILVAGEDSGGQINGIVLSVNVGDVQNLEVQ